MFRNILFPALAGVLLTLLGSSDALAWGGGYRHAGYTHRGAGGVTHVSTTRGYGSGGGGYRGASVSHYGSGGASAYHAGGATYGYRASTYGTGTGAYAQQAHASAVYR
ncbi:MAG: hypothetical protein ACJ8FY_24190 [Gemmataceae bacterium]